MKRVIIADLKSNNNHGICTGHYYALAANYREVFGPYCDVKIAGGPIYLKRFSESEMILLPYDFIAGESKIKNFFRMLFNARKLFKQVDKDDAVIIQQSQPAMILLVLFLTYFGHSNVFQIYYSEEPMRRFSFRLLMVFARKRMKGVICPNECVGNAFGVPYVSVPDYIYINKSEAQCCYSEKKYDFAIVGRIAKDKGVAEAVKTLAGRGCSLLVAGVPQDEEEEAIIREFASKCSNVELKLEYISDDDYDKYINASRYCILNYQGSYAERSSGVVLDTIFRNVPVVGRKCRALQVVERDNVGALYDDIASFDFSSLLNERIYESFLKSIRSYKHKMDGCRESLIKFVGVE